MMENLFSTFANALYGGNNLELDQRYRANTVFLAHDLHEDFNKGNLPENYFFDLGKKIDDLCADAYAQGMADGVNFGLGMAAVQRQDEV